MPVTTAQSAPEVGTAVTFRLCEGREYSGRIHRVINARRVMVKYDSAPDGKPVMFTLRDDGEWRRGLTGTTGEFVIGAVA